MKKRKVRIIAMPKAGSGLEVKINSGMGFNARQLNWPRLYNEFSAPDIEVKKTISGDPNPNIEAEGGETIVDDRDKDGIAEHYTISGPRHTHGGVDINAGENAFVFSDTKAMKIGGDVLKAFNKSTKKKLTPADIAKQYDINEYLKDLKDPDTDDIQRKTAEMMIANYNKKLGALALVQESKKGFDAGVPVIAHDYLQSIGMDPAMFSQNLGQSEQPDADMPAMARYGGNFPKAQNGNKGKKPEVNLAELYRERQKLIEEGRYKQYLLDKIEAEKPSMFQPFIDAKNQIKDYFGLINDRDYLMRKNAKMTDRYAELVKKKMLKPTSDNYSDKYGLLNSSDITSDNFLETFFPSKQQEDAKTEESIKYLVNQYNESKREGERLKHLYKNKKEYDEHLMDPYSPEKKAGQIKFLTDHPEYMKSSPAKPKVTTEAAAAAKKDEPAFLGVDAGVTEVPALTDTTLLNEGVWKSLPKSEKERLKKTYGSSNIFFEQRYGGELPIAQDGNKGKKKKSLADVEAQAGQGSGSGVNQGNWQASDLAPYAMNEAYTPKGLEYMNQFNKEYGLDLVDVNSGQIGGKAAVAKLQAAIIAKHPELVPDYMLNSSHKPNEQLMKIIPAGYTKDQAGLKKAYADGKISKEQISKGYQDNEWWYRALTSKRHKLNKADYDKQMAMPGSIKEGDKSYYRNEKSPLIYDEYYTEEDAPRDPGARVDDRPEADYKPTVNPFVPGTKRDVPNEYWLQDAIRQHGNARDYLTLKKYMPWQATPDVRLADAVFEDPNRGIAAMQEGVNAQNQLMGTFAGPQGLARSQASARGANSMADYIAGVANRNVDRANQLDVYNTGVLNQGAMNRAGLATQLFDKNTIANQQFDNSRRQILRNMDDTAINAETNRAYTHNLNQVNPHFNIRPGTGGDMAFTGYTDPLAPSYDDPQEWLKGYTSYKKVMPNLTVEEYQSIRNGGKGSKSKNPYADMVDAGMYPGGQQTSDPWE